MKTLRFELLLVTTLVLVFSAALVNCSASTDSPSAPAPTTDVTHIAERSPSDVAPTCEERTNEMAAVYGDAHLRLQRAYSGAFRGSEGNGSGPILRSTARAFAQKYRYMTTCEDETNEHFVEQIDRIAEEIEELQ